MTAEYSTTKQCTNCKKVKETKYFHKRKSSNDGLAQRCKECICIAVGNYRKNNKETLSETRSKYRKNNKEKITLYQKQYSKTEKYKQSNKKAVNKYIEKNKIKKKAHQILNNAVRSKKIIRPPICEDCGILKKTHGHHDDYSKPLDVRWLCIECHNKWHIENGQGRIQRAV